jgi:hypothetical protein
VALDHRPKIKLTSERIDSSMASIMATRADRIRDVTPSCFPAVRWVGVTLLFASCYQTPRPACAFLCGEDGACPDGYECGGDNRCHRVESDGSLAECPDPLPIDASEPVDAAFDAALDGPATAICATALTPIDDGTGLDRQTLLLAEINPGDFVELFNNAPAEVDLGATVVHIASGAVSVALSTVGTGVTIPAGGRATVTWPSAFTDVTEAGGEVVLYVDDTRAANEIMSFVCWGTGGGTIKTDAEANGKWTTGACPLALVGGALHRNAATDGKDAVDFDITTAPSPETCAP